MTLTQPIDPTESKGSGRTSPFDWQKGRKEAETAHAEVLKAAHVFEASLHLPPTERSSGWETGLRQELATIIKCFQRHCRAAEKPGGIIRQAEITLGKQEAVTDVLQSHEDVLKSAKALLRERQMEAHSGEAYPKFLRDAAQLMVALRAHEAKEIDLIYETHWRVNGGGD